MGSQVESISLGASGLRVSSLGIGTWAWGDRLFWGYGRDYADADLQAAFEASRAAGITWFDTAEIYGGGQSERLLGQFARAAGGPVAVATKFFPFPWRWRQSSVLNALRRSLQRLGLGQVDLYQIHQPFPPVAIETWMAGLADTVEAGLARAVGVSNYSPEQTRRAHAALARRGVPLASNQVAYSLLHRQPERDGLVEVCRDLNVTLIAYSPLAQGLLTGKYTSENPPPGLRGWRFNRRLVAQIQPLVALLSEAGAAHGGKIPAQVALNWVMCKGAVPIPGAKTARQAQDNAGALGWRLTDQEVAALDVASAAAQI
jgi:aryl-alcohol dehydrogenase-like predicted oxidoreductase